MGHLVCMQTSPPLTYTTKLTSFNVTSASTYCTPFWMIDTKAPGGTIDPLMFDWSIWLSTPKVNAECWNPNGKTSRMVIKICDRYDSHLHLRLCLNGHGFICNSTVLLLRWLRFSFTWHQSIPILKAGSFKNAVKSGAFPEQYSFIDCVNGSM